MVFELVLIFILVEGFVFIFAVESRYPVLKLSYFRVRICFRRLWYPIVLIIF
jgi:hypothetical protein